MSPAARAASSGSTTEIALELDVTDPASSERFVAAAVEQLGGIDILINNAGLALGRCAVRRVERGGRAHRLRDERERARAHDAPLPPAHPRRRAHRQSSARSPAGRRTRTRATRTSPRSSRCAASPTRCARTCSAGRSALTTVDAGLVETEFSIVRFKGDEEKADAVYEGVDPLTPDDIADCIMFALTRPLHVNVDEIVVKAQAQSSGGRIIRDP